MSIDLIGPPRTVTRTRRTRDSSSPLGIASFIVIALTAALAMSTDPSRASSSPGAPDTTRGIANRVPFATLEMESQPSSPASPEWLIDPRFRPRGVSLLARSLTGLPLGVSWTNWGNHGRPNSCEPFQGHQYSISFEDYWVFRCTEILAGGTAEYFTYLLHEGEPTLERARWSFDRNDVDAREVRAIYEAVVDTLTHLLGPPTPSEKPEFGRASRGEKWDFAHADGVITASWMSTSVPTFVIELRSMGLGSALNEEDGFDESVEAAQDPQALRREVVEALRTGWPALARATGTTQSSIGDAPQWREALARVQRGRPDQEVDHDLVHFAADLWMLGFGFESLADTLVTQELKSMRDQGIRLEPGYDPEFCYRGSLLDSLVVRAGANRWTDQALLRFQEMGWERACDCGGGSFPGSNQFRPVIERGEAFLKDHPNSAAWNAVALTVAQGHETAWSLAMGRCMQGDIGWDWKDYVLEAPRHRERATELYEKLLLRQPAIPALRSASRRLQRLRLNVDTNYHRYWCGMD